VFGSQPHPERCFFEYRRPDWTRDRREDEPYGDGKEIFESVLDFVERRF